MAHFVRLIVLLALALAGVVAQAAFPPTPTRVYSVQGGTGVTSPDAMVACMDAWRIREGLDTTVTPELNAYGYYTQCRFPGGGVVMLSSVVTNLCPAGGTLSGGQCVCDSGFEEQGSACVVVVDPAEAYCASKVGSTAVASSPRPGGAAGLDSYTMCYSNQYSMAACSGTMAPDMCGTGPDGKMHCTGVVTFGSGSAPCTGTTEPESPTDTPAPYPDPLPAGMCPGTVNGVAVNVPCSSTSTQSTTTSDSDDGAGNTTAKTESKTTQCNAAGSCTTTTTTTTTVNGGASTTTTTTTTQPKGEFCAANRGSPECGDGDGSSFGGSCAAGEFVCTGDAVQCATAKAVNEHLCKLKDVFEMDASTQALVESVMNGTWVEDPRENAEQVDVGLFDQSNPLSSACPLDVSAQMGGFTLVLPLSGWCSWLQMLGNMLVLVSLFGATVFVLRGKD